MLSRAFAALSLLLLAFTLALGCGSRASLYDGASGIGGGGAAGICQGDGFPCETDVACCNGDCDRGVCGGPACVNDGSQCSRDAECCSRTCDDGTCNTTCDEPGQACATDEECCSGDCNAGICVGEGCFDLGFECDFDEQCCTVLCAGGICASTCVPDGSGCIQPSDCCSFVCNGGICGGCQPNGAMCFDDFECCGGECGGGVCGGAPCPHDPCVPGEPLDEQCGDCVAQICEFDPFCCQSFWDDICVGAVELVCGQTCGFCSPDGDFCINNRDCCSGTCSGGVCTTPCTPNTGFCMSGFECCSGFCNAGICTDPCLSSGSGCMQDEDCCSKQCNGGVCDGQPCTHDQCEEGGPLDPSCGPCVAQICMADPFCCNAQWDGLCVQEVTTVCGETCGMCQPDGSMCMVGAQCCSGACVAGVCQPQCKPDGSQCVAFNECCSNTCSGGVCGSSCTPDGQGCMTDAECCSDQCNNFTCGDPMLCPSDGSPCGDCVAQNCCNNLIDCFQSPGCLDDVTCFFDCMGNGGGPGLCFFQCVNSPEAFQTLICVGTTCGPGICF